MFARRLHTERLHTLTRANHLFKQNVIRTMASGSRVHLEASQKPQYCVKGLAAESARTTTELLQINHEKYHIFFNKSGFHNHIAHHLLTLFALGATSKEIQQGYDTNVSYQRPPEPLKESIVDDMHKPDRFKTYLGKEQYYHDFLVFFQKEIEAKSWQGVLSEYMFARDERADDLLARLYAGFLHPIIHTGFGIEFQQPAIIAEGLAQACVHDNWMKSLFLGVEEAAEKNRGKSDRKTIVQLLEEVKQDEELSNSAHWEDGNKIRDGVMKRALEKMVGIASQYTIREDDDLEEKTAEMINAAGKSNILPKTTALTLSQYISQPQPNVRHTKSNSTSTTCTALPRPSSSRIFSLLPIPSLHPQRSAASWSGKSGTMLSCTHHVVHRTFSSPRLQTTRRRKTQTGTRSSCE